MDSVGVSNAMMRCAHYRCDFLAHPNLEEFGGFCCKMCFEWSRSKRRKVRHGKKCQQKEAPEELELRATPGIPREVEVNEGTQQADKTKAACGVQEVSVDANPADECWDANDTRAGTFQIVPSTSAFASVQGQSVSLALTHNNLPAAFVQVVGVPVFPQMHVNPYVCYEPEYEPATMAITNGPLSGSSMSEFSEEVQAALREENVTDLQQLTREDLLEFLERWRDVWQLGSIQQVRAAANLAPTEPRPSAEPRGPKRGRESAFPQECSDEGQITVSTRAVPKRSRRGEEVDLEVDEIFYTQHECSLWFRCGRTLQQLVDDLWSGKVDPQTDDFLHLSVVERPWSGGYRKHSTDNRRLWCLKEYKKRRVELGDERPLHIPCRLLSYEDVQNLRRNSKHFDTRNGGTTIKLRS